MSEYKAVQLARPDDVEPINRLAADGWTMVAVVVLQDGTAMAYMGRTKRGK